MIMYVLSYINIDEPKHSEVYGIYKNKDNAIRKLLEIAHYREDKYGNLSQCFKKTNKYPSFDDLYNKVFESMELIDHDIFRVDSIIII